MTFSRAEKYLVTTGFSRCGCFTPKTFSRGQSISCRRASGKSVAKTVYFIITIRPFKTSVIAFAALEPLNASRLQCP